MSSAVCLADPQGPAGADGRSLHPFTVRDSIELTRIVRFSDAGVNKGVTALYSPGGERFVVRIRRGDIADDVNVDTVLCFETREVTAYLAADTALPPRPRTLAQISWRNNNGAISSLQWIDEWTIAFIAQGDNGKNQVHLAEVLTERQRQATQADTHVTAFEFTGSRLLFSQQGPAKDIPQVESVGGRNLFQVLSSRFDPDRSGMVLIKEIEPWNGASSAQAKSAARSELRALPSIDRIESINSRPKLYAGSESCNCRKLLLDPAPKADAYTFGHHQTFSWSGDGRAWTGGIVFPLGYDVSRRYPLVVQTHGYSADEFLVDGPGFWNGAAAAMAAQALANAGFVVLQAPDVAAGAQDEARVAADMIDAAISALDKRGIVDVKRVGVITFSRTGLHGIRLLAEHPGRIRAMVMADGPWWGYALDLAMTNSSPAVLEEIRSVSGGAPDVSNMGEWFRNNPLYRLPLSGAAVRFEEYGATAGMGYWEHYALLRRAGRDVDYVLFPHGEHLLKRPSERLASQGGTVDWFRRWLNDDKRSAVAATVHCPGYETDDPLSWLEERYGERALQWVKAQNTRSLKALESHRDFAANLEIARSIASAEQQVRGSTLFNGWLDGRWIYSLDKSAQYPRGRLQRSSVASLTAGAPQWRDVPVAADASAPDVELNLTQLQFAPAGGRALLVSASARHSSSLAFREYDFNADVLAADGFNLSTDAVRMAEWFDDRSLLVTVDEPRQNFEAPYVVKTLRWLRRGQTLDGAERLLTSAPGASLLLNTLPLDGARRMMLVFERRNGSRDRAWRVMPDRSLIELSVPVSAGSRLLRTHRGRMVFSLDAPWRVGQNTWQAGSIVAVPLEDIAAKSARVELVRRPFTDLSIKFDWSPRPQDGVIVTAGSYKGDLILRYTRTDAGWKEHSIDIPLGQAIYPGPAEARTGRLLGTHLGVLNRMALFELLPQQNRIRYLAGLPAQFDNGQFVVERLWATSRDGVQVPYEVVRAKTISFDGDNPTIMSGYGFAGAAHDPTYDGFLGRLWLERGGVYVNTRIRGGNELGPGWYVTGTDRQRTYDDFIAVGEDLIRRGITSPRRLGISGMSAGGLLTATAMIQRPELFNAALLQVPFVDLLRWDLSMWGCGGTVNFGDPYDPATRVFWERTSPYQNLKRTDRFPVPFIVTSTTDDNVNTAYPRKFAAKMQDLGLPFFYYESAEGGHFVWTTPEQHALFQALLYTYFARQLM